MSTATSESRDYSAAAVAFPILEAYVGIGFDIAANVDVDFEMSGDFLQEFERTLISVGVPGISVPDVSCACFGCHDIFVLNSLLTFSFAFPSSRPLYRHPSNPQLITIGPELKLVGSGKFELKGDLEVTTGMDFAWKGEPSILLFR